MWFTTSDISSGVISKNEQHLRGESLFSWPYPVLRMRYIQWLCMPNVLKLIWFIMTFWILPRGPWVKGPLNLVGPIQNPFWLISIIIHPIRKVRVFPYYARSNEKLKENFRAAISEGKSWQMESPKNLCATEQIGFLLVEDHLVCFCSIANFEQKSIIGTLSRTLVKIQFVANAFEGISR